jgi:hypothetical protein
MGGLLVREYCRQEPVACKKQIRKLITLDTPFGGTELARLLRDVRNRQNRFLHPAEKILINRLQTEGCQPQKTVCRPLGPAVDDLVPGSDALTILPELPIPTHVLVGITADGVFGYDSSLVTLWQEGLSKIFGYVPDTSFTHLEICGFRGRSKCKPLFGSQLSDRMVSADSQGGSVKTVGQYDDLYAVDHMTVHSDPNSGIFELVRDLLDVEPGDEKRFTPVLPRGP